MWAALPMAAFLVLFIGACLALELGGFVLFGSREGLLLILVLPWVWWLHHAGRGGLRGWRAWAALLTRFALIAVFAVLLADPRAVRRDDVLSVVYALDVSDSIGQGASDAALEYVAETVSKKPEKDEAGLVVFGQDAAVELPPRMSFPFEAINSRIRADGTNLETSLSLAGAMLPEEHLGRIVLISDGTQTEGNLSAVLDQLDARDIAVDVLPIQYAYEHEVWMEKLQLPRYVKAGETYEASVVLSSLKAGSGKLTLKENGKTIYEGEVEFNAGKNRFMLPLYLREPGYYEYVATIDTSPQVDGWRENNRAVNHLYLEGEGKVLVVTDPNGDPRDTESLVTALRQGRFAVDKIMSYQFPRDALSLMPYDCVVVPNVPADAFDVVQMEALHDAVYNQGAGFLMVGGQNSFGPGGYHRTAVEKALPVSMDITQKKVLPKGALIIILHTCEFPEGNTWGKRIAKEATRVLGAKDEVGVLVYGYGGRQQWVFPLTPAAEYERLVLLINQAQIGDMPTFGTTMQMGLDALKASDAAMKHMIIISDGDPSPPTPQLLKDFAQAKVTVSTVAINPHRPQDISVMQAIARATGGRFYFPSDPRLLPSIFIKEAKTLKRSMIQNVVFTPTVEIPSPILKAIESVPALRGYVLTTAKGRATVILKGPEKEQVDPVLATWRYGIGKTAAFTSDLSPNWGAEWVQWQGYLPFVKQLVTDISRTKREGHLQMRAFASGGTGVVNVEDFHPRDSFLEVAATVSGPHGRSERIRLRQTAPRRYEGRFGLWGKGRYQVAGMGGGDGRSETVLGGFVVPYSPEYLRFRANPGVLSRIAEKTGGRVLTGDTDRDEIFVRDRKPKASSRPIADWFLVLLVCLVPFDVGVRRVHLDLGLIRRWLGLGRVRGPSTETLDALLKRKSAIRFGPGEEAEAVRRLVVPPAAPEAATPADQAMPPEQKEPEREEEEAGELPTTKRLLTIKKKWKKPTDQGTS